MLEILPARNGSLCARLGGRWLASPYDPAREADRFVQAIEGISTYSAFVVLGSCMGHIEERLLHAREDALIVSIRLDARFDEISLRNPSWSPSSMRGLDEFLASILRGVDPDAMRIIEWLPAKEAWPERFDEAARALLDHFRATTMATATVSAHGPSWFRNCVRNFLGTERYALLSPSAGSWAIALSGPSASYDAIPRGLPVLLATSAARAYSRKASAPARIMIATDGGYYASRICREAPPEAAEVFARPLCASDGGISRRLPVALLNQSSWLEGFLIAGSGIPSIPLLPHGTVAGSAIRLARALGASLIAAYGLDLAVKGLIEHARPHSFDPLVEAASSRLNPATSAWASRIYREYPDRLGISDWRSSPKLREYARQIESDLASSATPLLRLSDSPQELRGSLTRERIYDPASFSYRIIQAPSLGFRISRLHEAFKALEDSLSSANEALEGARAEAALKDLPDALWWIASPALLRARRHARFSDHLKARACLAEARSSLDCERQKLARLFQEVVHASRR
jgi:hypothetical protein